MRPKHLITERPVRITPMCGTTASIVITSPGFVAVDTIYHPTAPRRRRRVTLCDTGHATLKRSAQGQNRIVTLILPTERATPEQFYQELDHLIDMACIKGVL